MILLTASSASVSSAHALELGRVLHRADADDRALARISRGTEWTVPMPPGLVSEIVVPAKSSMVSLPLPGPADDVLVGRPELARSPSSSAPLIDGTTSEREPSGFGRSMARPRLTCSGCDQRRLAVDLGEGVVHRPGSSASARTSA